MSHLYTLALALAALSLAGCGAIQVQSVEVCPAEPAAEAPSAPPVNTAEAQ